MAHFEPTWSSGLSPAMVTKAELELRETEERKRESLLKIKQLVEKDPDFCPPMEEAFLLFFLRVKKYKVTEAFNLMKSYFGCMAKYSGYVTDLTPRDVERILEMNKVIFSPTISSECGGVFVASFGTFDLDVATAEQHLAVCFCSAQVALGETMQVCGGSLVIDFQQYTTRHVLNYCSYSMAYIFLQVLTKACIYRVKGIHAVFEPQLFTVLYNKLWKHLMPKKVKDRTHFHGKDLSSLHRHIPKEQLPESLGGTLGTADYVKFREEMCKRQDIGERLRTYVYKGKSYPLSLNSMWQKET